MSAASIANDEGLHATNAEKLGRLMEGMDELKLEVRENLRPSLHQIKNSLASFDNLVRQLEDTKAEARSRYAEVQARVTAIEMRHAEEDKAKLETKGWRSGLRAPLVWCMVVIGTFGTISMAVVGGLSMYDAIADHLLPDGPGTGLDGSPGPRPAQAGKE